MADMPTSTQVKGSFGGKGAQVQARNTAADMRAQERAGRLVREAQVKTNCSFVADVDCTFGSDTPSGQYVSDWIEFGSLRFTAEPGISCGSKHQTQDGEPTLDKDANNYDPALHFSAPTLVQLLRTRTDDRGMINAAKVIIWAVGGVPEGFRVKASVTFTGPAILKG